MVAACRRLGMEYWLYDEGGWPSGGACGQVLAKNPQGFARMSVQDSPSGPVVRSAEPHPEIAAIYPNLLTPGVTDTFIKLTHERHRKYVGKYFGDTIRFAFMDEPVAPATYPGRLTWTPDLGQVFRERKGYALEPFFADLLKKPSDAESRAVVQARVDFYDVWSQLFVERFLEPIRQWGRKNKVLSSGHFGGEDVPHGNADYGYGHILRALRGLDVPGIDLIWRQLFPVQPGGTVYYDEPAGVLRKTRAAISSPFVKYASSVARQAGQPYVMSESFGVYGNGLTPAQLKWLADYQLVRGVTLWVFGVYPYSTRGHLIGGERPHHGFRDPLWKYFDLYHHYVARLGYLLTRGRPVCATAFYYDIRSIWAGGSARERAIADHLRLAEALLKRQCDFDFIDDDALAQGRVNDGAITIGKMRYDTLIVPPTQWMAPEEQKNLAAFQQAGGRVLGMDAVRKLAPVAKVTPATEAIRVTKRAFGRRTLYFFTNEAPVKVRARLELAEGGAPVLCDPLDGKFYAVSSLPVKQGAALDWEFEPFGSALFLFGAQADAAWPRFRPGGTVISLNDGWTIRPLKQHKVGRRDFMIVTLRLPARPARLGDWRASLGSYFSGDARYAIEFESPSARSAQLDLGQVRYACSARLNGQELGRKFWGPHVFALDNLRKGKNTLEVVVTNCLANAIADPAVERHWKDNFRPASPYEQTQRAFEKESLSSGLIGPVRILCGM